MLTRSLLVLCFWCACWLGVAVAASCSDVITCDDSNPCPATSSACPALICSPIHICVESFATDCPDGGAAPEDAAPAPPPPILCYPDAGCDPFDAGSVRD